MGKFSGYRENGEESPSDFFLKKLLLENEYNMENVAREKKYNVYKLFPTIYTWTKWTVLNCLCQVGEVFSFMNK